MRYPGSAPREAIQATGSTMSPISARIRIHMGLSFSSLGGIPLSFVDLARSPVDSLLGELRQLLVGSRLLGPAFFQELHDFGVTRHDSAQAPAVPQIAISYCLTFCPDAIRVTSRRNA
jgi:hypothetical protein